MNIQFLFENVDVSARTRVYIEKRLASVSRVLKEREIPATLAEVGISKEKRGNYRVEIMIKAPKSTYRSEETAETIEASTDAVEEELKRQIREEQEKIETLHKRGARSIKKKLTIDKEARF